jgi:nitrile hydratase accessory protein
MIAELRPEQVAELSLPSEAAVPVFAAPWEASAFAMVLALHRAGRFAWRDWVELLAAEIGAAEPDPTGALYYERWTRALEKLLARLGLLTEQAIGERTLAWRAAYLATPHGQEVRLGRAEVEPNTKTPPSLRRAHGSGQRPARGKAP